MTKRLMHVSIAILCLALAYHLGYRNAGAQSPGNPVVATFGSGSWTVVTANGDIYMSNSSCGPWNICGNIFGGPTPVEGASLGQVKVRYR